MVSESLATSPVLPLPTYEHQPVELPQIQVLVLAEIRDALLSLSRELRISRLTTELDCLALSTGEKAEACRKTLIAQIRHEKNHGT